MENQKHIDVVKKLFSEVYSKGNFSLLDQLVTNDFKLRDPVLPNFKGGLRGLRELEESYHKAFPQKTIKIDQIFSAGDAVVVEWTCSMQHKGEWHGIAPTNKQAKICGVSIYRFSGDKISEICQQWDRLGMLEQLGIFDITRQLHSISSLH